MFHYYVMYIMTVYLNMLSVFVKGRIICNEDRSLVVTMRSHGCHHWEAKLCQEGFELDHLIGYLSHGAVLCFCTGF